jgi:FkbM family methyltransferase
MTETPLISYAQRYEDLYLMRCFGARGEGFYIDIGAGHPVYDNVSFAFYLKGWSGVTVEPNPWLAQLGRAVRPRDRHVEALVGAASGQATFYLVDEFHGFSTMIESHAQTAQREFGKSSQALIGPVTTLRDLCEAYAPAAFDFLKIDVEGAEADVILHGDWQNFRPRIAVVEALAPYTQAPAAEAWEPFLARQSYRPVWFDSLNRYYLAEEAGDLAQHFEDAPAPWPARFEGAELFRDMAPALENTRHPDHALATVIAKAAMRRLPVFDRALLLEFVTADLAAAELDRRAEDGDLARLYQRLFACEPPMPIAEFNLAGETSVRELYRAIIDSDAFRTACGRISASYGW